MLCEAPTAQRIVPPALWRHLGKQLGVAAPDLASLRSMYQRRRTLFEHQEVACETLGFHWLSDARRRALVRVLRGELARTSDRQRLLQFARRWLYEHRLIVRRERDLRMMIIKAIREHEAGLARTIVEGIDPLLLAQWRAAVTQPQESGATAQTWLWAPPAKRSSRQIEEVLERIQLLTALGVDRHLTDLPDAIVRRYARRLATRTPAVAARIAEPARTIEVACFLRYCLLTQTDHLLLMVRRRVADLWRIAAVGVDAKLADWARLYQELLGELGSLASDAELSSDALREQLVALLQAQRARRPRSRAEIVRDRLIEGVRPVRALLKALMALPWKARAAHPLLEVMQLLHGLYEQDLRALPTGCTVPLGRVWRKALGDEDRERAFAAAEVATLLGLRRALRNGTMWIEHSLAFRGRETLFIPQRQLPELILQIDAQVRFSWIMLGREPRSTRELLMVYAGILAHGTALSAAETARMIPQLSPASVRQAMKWASDERRLSEACSAVLTFMHRHSISATWGRADLASADMMSMETNKRVFLARTDPRRQTASIGIYTHVRDRWGISHAQPILLNERQAGAAIEGVIRDERLETSLLAVDTHGYTDVAMAIAKLLGFDLCPRLRALRDRHLFLPHGSDYPDILRSICHANIDLAKIAAQWEQIVHLVASVHSGHTSAIQVLARFGAAARGDPLYEALAQLGRLLRTVFLADYFINEPFRRELLRVLNRGESVNSLKRAIYVGRVASYQAKQHDEMQAVADALSLLANIVMAWNTMKMQLVLDRWNTRPSTAVPPELIGRIAPTRTEGINLLGVFSFPIEQYVEHLLPTLAAINSRAVGA